MCVVIGLYSAKASTTRVDCCNAFNALLASIADVPQ